MLLKKFIITTLSIITFFLTAYSELSQEFIDETNSKIETLRKGMCKIVVKKEGVPVSSKEINIKQIRNHFGFGGSITKKCFGVDSQSYANSFLRYFEWATPENEMKWEYTDEADDYQNYEDADWLISWCEKNDINVRGHCLFWNEDEKWIPSWAKNLDTTNFKIAMEMRIESAVSHFKGKLKHWDIINEIIHAKDSNGVGGTLKIPGMLSIKSGKPDVFSWIIKKAKEIDPDVKMFVNEYNVIECASNAYEYINEIKKIENEGAKIDIVGLEGHFGGCLERERYLKRIDTLASALDHPLWLTEVDFTIDKSIRADKMEELMRTCFAHPRIHGLVLWVWWEGNRWRETLTSYLVDSNFTENELGERWRKVRDEWKTNTRGITDDEGRFSFKGFYGKYIVSYQEDDNCFVDTIYFEPGKEGEIEVDLNNFGCIGVKYSVVKRKSNSYEILFNGNKVKINSLLQKDKENLYFYIFSVNGKYISRIPIKNIDKNMNIKNFSKGCYLFTFGNEKNMINSGKIFNLK